MPVDRKLRVIDLAGTPYETGRQHGARLRDDIRALADQRLRFLVEATGGTLTREQIIQAAADCLPYHQTYAPEQMEELRGIHDETSVGLADLIILSGFTDMLDVVNNLPEVRPGETREGCTAFMVSPQASANGLPLIGQTWDMSRETTPYALIVRAAPRAAPRFVTLTVAGCTAMIGVNEAGIAIGITNLSTRDGQAGVTWTFVVRKALAQDNFDAAIACIMEAPLAGAHNYFLADAGGRCINIEATPTRKHVDEIEAGTFAHTNHCLIPNLQAVEILPDVQFVGSTHGRLDRARELLNGGATSLTDLMTLTRDHGNGDMVRVCVHASESNHFVESGAGVILSPATHELWAVWGTPCLGEYERFTPLPS